VPEMVYKVPEVPEKYLSFDVEGIKIYISKRAALGASSINFTLKGFFIYKGIVAEGIQYPKV
jgi:hypothetical protein